MAYEGAVPLPSKVWRDPSRSPSVAPGEGPGEDVRLKAEQVVGVALDRGRRVAKRHGHEPAPLSQELEGVKRRVGRDEPEGRRFGHGLRPPFVVPGSGGRGGRRDRGSSGDPPWPRPRIVRAGGGEAQGAAPGQDGVGEVRGVLEDRRSLSDPAKRDVRAFSRGAHVQFLNSGRLRRDHRSLGKSDRCGAARRGLRS